MLSGCVDLGPHILPFCVQAPADRPTVFTFWAPLIDTSKLRGEANISIERMASIRTMVMRTILKQVFSQTERAKLFCNKFWDLSDMIYESFR